MENSYSEKSQLLIFDNRGTITYSSNTLFDASELTGKNIFEQFQLLKCIEPDLENLTVNGQPLFLPHIAFSCNKYKSICDFIFTRVKKINSEETVWMINDNSVHYEPVLVNARAADKKQFAHYNINHKEYRSNYLR